MLKSFVVNTTGRQVDSRWVKYSQSFNVSSVVEKFYYLFQTVFPLFSFELIVVFGEIVDGSIWLQ